MRIVPALAVDTVVTILLIGLLLTVIPIGEYLSSPQTFSYLATIFSLIHYYLPGVFEANPLVGVVNGSLCKISAELGCYVFISGLIFIGWVSHWKRTLVLAVATIAFIMAAPLLLESTPAIITRLANHPGALLVPEFLIGSVMYLKRDSIPYSAPLFFLCIALILASGFVLPEAVFSVMPASSALAIPLYGYVAVFVGATQMPKLPLFSRGDYSYGIYLYGFPIQQAIVAATGVLNPFGLFFMTIVPVTVLAMCSWHLVEKPTLRLRKGFSMAAKMEPKRQSEGQ